VLFEHIYDVLTNQPDPCAEPNKPYFAALEHLTAQEWLRSG